MDAQILVFERIVLAQICHWPLPYGTLIIPWSTKL